MKKILLIGLIASYSLTGFTIENAPEETSYSCIGGRNEIKFSLNDNELEADIFLNLWTATPYGNHKLSGVVNNYGDAVVIKFKESKDFLVFTKKNMAGNLVWSELSDLNGNLPFNCWIKE